MNKRKIGVAGVLVSCALLGSSANAQNFTNGGFESGTLSGWLVQPTYNGQTLVETVEMIDIDGQGPLPLSTAGKFSVGSIEMMHNQQAGIDLVQMINLAAGVEYIVSANWAALRTTGPVNEEGGVFSIVFGEEVLVQEAAGPTGPELPRHGLLRASVIPAAGGTYRIGIRMTRPFRATPGLAQDLHQWLDNVQIVMPVQGACCMSDGTCRIISEFRCQNEDGVYRGNGTTCAGANCPAPGGCCRFLDCGILSEWQCTRQWGEYQGHGSTCTPCQPMGTLLPISGHSSTFSSDAITRGMWFIAPRDFEITGLRVPDPGGHGVQNLEVVRLPDTPPGTPQNALNNFESLGRFIGEPSARIIPVSIQVATGEVIGVLGNCGSGDMMHHSSGAPYHSVLLGEPVHLRRLSMTGNLNTTAAQNIFGSDDPLVSIARVEFYYAKGSGGCYPNCDGSTVEPILNVDDFTCFINGYAQGQSLPHAQQIEHYANCDGSSVAPALNVDDFTCFINAYAQGCP